jgi:hypothetical protein
VTAVAVLVLALLSAIALPPGISAARYAPSNGWCGSSQKADWACGWEGASYLTPPGGIERPLLLRSSLLLPGGSRVKAAPSGSAHLTFRAKAHCIVGGKSAETSEVVARWEPDVLMRQISGDSSCTIRGREAPITTFCEASEAHCPVRIRALGTFLLQGPKPYPEALASLSESFERQARLVICDGVARIKVEGEPEEAVGRADGHNRFVITIDEAIAHVEAEATSPSSSAFAEATASIISLTVIGTLRGPGPCEASGVQEQERSVES